MDRAWDVLLDVERVAPCMPGATVTSVDGDVVHATVKVKVGPISMAYAGTARFVEKDRAAGVVLLEASGKETKGSGTASAKIRSVLTDGGDETHVTVLTTLNVTGRPAQFGRGVMSDVSGRLLTIFATNLAALLSEPDGATADSETTAGAVVGSGAEAGLRAEYDQSIDELKLPTRVTSSLHREGLATVGQLTGRTEDQLLAIDGIGQSSVKEIRTKLGERGLTLGRTPGGSGASHAASNGAGGSVSAAVGTGTAETGSVAGSADAEPGTAGTGTEGTGSAERASAERASADVSSDQSGPHRSAAREAVADLENDALNLLRVAGLPILKRALPVLAGLAAIALVGLRARYRHRRQRD
jgi:carbon monoxide dehydrogenase subunit G